MSNMGFIDLKSGVCRAAFLLDILREKHFLDLHKMPELRGSWPLLHLQSQSVASSNFPLTHFVSSQLL